LHEKDRHSSVCYEETADCGDILWKSLSARQESHSLILGICMVPLGRLDPSTHEHEILQPDQN